VIQIPVTLVFALCVGSRDPPILFTAPAKSVRILTGGATMKDLAAQLHLSVSGANIWRQNLPEMRIWGAGGREQLIRKYRSKAQDKLALRGSTDGHRDLLHEKGRTAAPE
jgi:hypothetical protein